MTRLSGSDRFLLQQSSEFFACLLYGSSRYCSAHFLIDSLVILIMSRAAAALRHSPRAFPYSRISRSIDFSRAPASTAGAAAAGSGVESCNFLFELCLLAPEFPERVEPVTFVGCRIRPSVAERDCAVDRIDGQLSFKPRLIERAALRLILSRCRCPGG